LGYWGYLKLQKFWGVPHPKTTSDFNVSEFKQCIYACHRYVKMLKSNHLVDQFWLGNFRNELSNFRIRKNRVLELSLLKVPDLSQSKCNAKYTCYQSEVTFIKFEWIANILIEKYCTKKYTHRDFNCLNSF